MELSFTVLGKPQPAGSKRAFAIKKDGEPTGQVAVTDANPKAKSWQREVRDVARDALYAYVLADEPDAMAAGLLTGPLRATMVFYCQRPKAHFGTGRNADLLKPGAPQFPTGRPDSLKLARGTEDALTGTVWKDDAQVVDLDVHKRYGVPERCEITIRTVGSGAH